MMLTVELCALLEEREREKIFCKSGSGILLFCFSKNVMVLQFTTVVVFVVFVAVVVSE